MRQGIGLWMKQVGAGDRNQQFSLGHVKFELTIRSPSRDVEDAVEYVGLDFRKEVSAGDINLDFNIYEF